MPGRVLLALAVCSLWVPCAAASNDDLAAAMAAVRQTMALGQPRLMKMGLRPGLVPPAAPPLGRTLNRYFGGHAPIFVVEKSHHRENILIVYATLTPDCRLGRDARGHKLGFYWLDRGTDFHFSAMEGQIRSRLQLEDEDSGDSASFRVRMTELGRVRHDLSDERMLIKAEKVGGVCEARAYLSPGGRRVRVASVFTDATPRGFDADVHSVTLRGHDAANENAVFERRYPGNR